MGGGNLQKSFQQFRYILLYIITLYTIKIPNTQYCISEIK